jgi:hypothetical protein
MPAKKHQQNVGPQKMFNVVYGFQVCGSFEEETLNT